MKHCPTCGAPDQRKPAMIPLELRVIRGLLGLRSGGRGPLPRHAMGNLLGRTERQVYNYETGRTPIPPRVAEKARRLRQRATGNTFTRGR